MKSVFWHFVTAVLRWEGAKKETSQKTCLLYHFSFKLSEEKLGMRPGQRAKKVIGSFLEMSDAAYCPSFPGIIPTV